MKEFIGKRVKFGLEGMPPFTAIVVGDQRDVILVRCLKKTEESVEPVPVGGVIRLVKTKVTMFEPMDGEPVEVTPLHVLYCENSQAGCDGVQFIHAGEGFTRKDVEAFMAPCPCMVPECRRGSKGELRCVESAFLAEMLKGTLYGDYPKAEKE